VRGSLHENRIRGESPLTRIASCDAIRPLRASFARLAPASGARLQRVRRRIEKMCACPRAFAGTTAERGLHRRPSPGRGKTIGCSPCPRQGGTAPSRIKPPHPTSRFTSQTALGRMTTRSRGGVRPSSAIDVAPEQREGAGNAGCWPHPWPACRKKAGGSHHRFSRNNRHSPRDGFNVYFVLSSVHRAFWPPSPLGSSPGGLASASGCQDHTTSRPPA